jgi:hypothetical protein
LDGVVKPLRTPGIDRFDVKKNDELIESVTRDEIPPLPPPMGVVPALTQLSIRTLHEGVHIVAYRIIKLSYVETHKWSFGEGKDKFSADIKDKDFWQQVHDKQISFTEGDILRGLLSIKVARTSKGIHNEYSFLKVLEFIKVSSPTQQKLF